MKMFLASLCTNPEIPYGVLDKYAFKWNLMSYYYCRGRPEVTKFIIDKSDEVLIDSGAFSFQQGKSVDYDQYTEEYIDFIRENDCDRIIGFFEMDIDVIVGYEKVLELRRKIESVTDKCIPVWHPNRGVHEFTRMCEQYSGRIVAITGVGNRDISAHQYGMFLREAWKYNCKLHCLGMTNMAILKSVPFDYVDSSSWKMEAIFGKVRGRKVRKGYNFVKAMIENYGYWTDKQKYFYDLWEGERERCLKLL